MDATNEAILEKYLLLPGLLEAAVAGLSEHDLDLCQGDGWSIREYVHHTMEGMWMWHLYLHVILGQDGAEFPISWYFAMSQAEWARQWAYGKRAIEPSVSLYRASISNLVELMQHEPLEAWEHYGRVTWPGAESESCLTVRDIIQMHIRHCDGHIADIKKIREFHGV